MGTPHESNREVKDMILLDIEMPETCSECPLLSEEIWCTITGTSVWQNHIDYNKERLPDCPILQKNSIKN